MTRLHNYSKPKKKITYWPREMDEWIETYQTMTEGPETPITADNIVRVFEYWVTNVLNDSKMDPKDVLNTFLTLLTQPQECYLHPKKVQFLMIGEQEVRVKPKMYKAFFTLYKETHNPLELRAITANKDRLLQEIYRRRTGAFFTPSLWVNEAHQMIAEQFGVDWKEKYIVWDCSCGTMNLTRDYKFKELYCSTLEQSDLDIAIQAGYNPEATKFQFDFLNDDESKLPEGLRKALAENRPIIFFNNPPYGTATTLFFKDEGTNTKNGVCATKVNEEMSKNNIGSCSEQLYAQFLYRMMMLIRNYKLTKCEIGVFTKSAFLSGDSFEGFRKEFLKTLSYKNGMLFQASHFADVADTWGISFTIFASGCSSVTEYKLKIKDIGETGNIVTLAEKSLYNLDGVIPAAKWVRGPIKGIKTEDAPQMTSGVIVTNKGNGKCIPNSLGYMFSYGNNVQFNGTHTGILSAPFSNAHGTSIAKENFWQCIALFSARKLITPDWINDKDEYMVPNTEHPDYQQWLNDALVYSLFNTSSNQSSLRQVDYKGKKWDIVNHFFFMSLAEIEALAVTHNNNEVYNDCKSHPPDRFVYEQLTKTTLSPDAQKVLDMARELVRKSFSLRDACNGVKPEMHINSWDAGWYQIKNGLLKDNFKADYDAFVVEYKALENRLREGVYTFGFLRK